jgi:transposase
VGSDSGRQAAGLDTEPVRCGARAWRRRIVRGAAQRLPESAREQITVALAMIDALDGQLAPIDRELGCCARRQAGCQALMAHYGIGPLVAVTILSELGVDCRRFSSSRQAVRNAGIEREGLLERVDCYGTSRAL